MKIRLIYLLIAFTNNFYAYDLRLKPSFFDGNKYSFSFDKFIDARLGKEKVVGYTRLGISNKIEGILLPRYFAQYCDTLFSRPGIKYDSRVKLIPVITQVTIQETHRGGKEYSNVSLAMDFYRVEDDVCFLYYSSFTEVNAENGFDITKKHHKNLAKAFENILSSLNFFVQAENFSPLSEKIKVSVLKDRLDAENNNLNNLPLKDGIYFSCKSLANNNPALALNNLLVRTDTSLKDVEFYGDGFFKNNLFFAFVKSNVLYIHIRGSIYHKAALEPESKLAYYKDLTRKSANIGAGIVSAGLGSLFGLAGILAGSALRHATVKTERIDKLYIDLETGLLDVQP